MFSFQFDSSALLLTKTNYGKAKTAIPGEHLYSHFFAESHVGLNDVRVQIIDRINVTTPTEREAFWRFKFDSFVPQGLNIKDFM